MAGAAVTVAFGLSTGFDRAAARADLPDVLVRFRPEARDEVDGVLRRLPDLDRATYRLEVDGVPLAAGDRRAGHGAPRPLGPPARGRRARGAHVARPGPPPPRGGGGRARGPGPGPGPRG